MNLALERKIRGVLMKLPGMIDCMEFEKFMLAYIDDDLPPTQRRVMERHLRVCPDCRRYISDYRRTLGMMNFSKMSVNETLSNVPEDLIQAILDASTK